MGAMRKGLIFCLLGLGCLVLGTGVGKAAIIYASSGNLNVNGGGRIYTIDTLTQTVTLIGDTGLNRTSGLAFDNNGNLYLTDRGSAGPSRFYSVNPNTAAVTLIGSPGIQGIGGIAFDSSGTL
jgi:hypothetical protein